MNNEILISVVMPVYNGERFLREAIGSILEQSYPYFEFIIINDGSRDNSLNILNSYDDGRIKLISNSVNKGISEALNQGIRIANGKYIARMDCDDIAHSDRLKLQLDFMENHEDIAVCGTQYVLLEDLGVPGRTPIEHENILLRMLNGCPFSHPSVFIRSEVFKKYGFTYQVKYNYTEDYKLWVDLAIAGFKFRNLEQELIWKRNHEQRVSVVRRSIQARLTDDIRRQYFNVRFNYLSKDEITALCLQISNTSYFDISKFNSVLKKVYDYEKLHGHGAARQLIKTIYPYTINGINPYFSWKEYLQMMSVSYPYKYLTCRDNLRLLKRVLLRQKG